MRDSKAYELCAAHVASAAIVALNTFNVMHGSNVDGPGKAAIAV
jgi:hypothetical protein